MHALLIIGINLVVAVAILVAILKDKSDES